MASHPSLRIASIDILRAITMLLMIFVNDLWTLHDIPGWLEHTAAEADDMGLADTVFPAFLFIVGMSIPLSLLHRRQKGENKWRISMHIVERSIALLVMGLFLVNGEYLNEAASGIPRGLWFAMSALVFILMWNQWPEEVKGRLVNLIKLSGLLVLIALAWAYRGGETKELHRFTTHWWGILGLIGWAYLVTALILHFANNNFWVALAAWLLFLFTCIASHAGWIPAGSPLKPLLAPFGDGAMPAFTMGGSLASLILLWFRKKDRPAQGLLLLFVLAALLIAAGLYLRPSWGISKIRATPSWVLICSGITLAVFVPLYWLADIKKKTSWYKPIEPAGTNTLLCYLLPYLVYALVGVLQLHLPAMLLGGAVGLLKSALFAFLIILIAGALGRVGVRLRL